jgi:hypothetical protein
MMTSVHPDILFDIRAYFNYLFFIIGHLDAKVMSAEAMVTDDTYYAVKLSSLRATEMCWPQTSKLFHRLDRRRSFGLQGGHLYNTNMDTNWARGEPLITMAHRGSQRSLMLTLLQNKGLAFSAPSTNFAHHITRDVVLLNIIQRMYHEHVLATIRTIKDQDEAQRVFQKKNKYIQLEIGRLLGQ